MRLCSPALLRCLLADAHAPMLCSPTRLMSVAVLAGMSPSLLSLLCSPTLALRCCCCFCYARLLLLCSPAPVFHCCCTRRYFLTVVTAVLAGTPVANVRCTRWYACYSLLVAPGCSPTCPHVSNVCFPRSFCCMLFHLLLHYCIASAPACCYACLPSPSMFIVLLLQLRCDLRSIVASSAYCDAFLNFA
jgi:hypothetical protein